MSPYITVTDAAGRVLFRRPATDAEVRDAIRAAEVAEVEGEAALARIYAERAAMDDRELGQA
jgi:SOS response regulatory protein OraA/RecX